MRPIFKPAMTEHLGCDSQAWQCAASPLGEFPVAHRMPRNSPSRQPHDAEDCTAELNFKIDSSEMATALTS